MDIETSAERIAESITINDHGSVIRSLLTSCITRGKMRNGSFDSCHSRETLPRDLSSTARGIRSRSYKSARSSFEFESESSLGLGTP